VTSVPSPPAANPYPGLRPFEENEEHLFFGREQQIDRMVDTLAAQRLLAVIGGSGSGKSSLVNCGLRPALRRGLMGSAGTDWTMVRFRPGLHPISSLAAALVEITPAVEGSSSPDLPISDVIATNLGLSRLGLLEFYGQHHPRGDVNLLVVVDQFEELFRYRSLRDSRPRPTVPKSSAEEGLALVNLLLATREQRRWPIFIVLTMRSDFLGDCAQFHGLPEAITAGLHLLPRLSREERRDAIINPALVSGATVDPVLVTRLVNDAGDDPDQLSILQHALRRSWEHWRSRGAQGPISLADYEAIGTMATALDSHAEQTFASCGGPEEARICRRLFQALTDTASDPRGIRRPTRLADLWAICGADPNVVTRLVDHFRQSDRAFLMPPAGESLRPDSVIDISHESLMRVWKRLDQWANEEAESAALFRRLADAARRHAQGRASLWRDPELRQALNWREAQHPTDAWARRYDSDPSLAFTFLERGERARDDERRRQVRQRRRLLAGLAGLSLLASLVAAFCWTQWQRTRLSRARAYAATAAALLPGRPHESLVYGVAAMERLIHEPAEALSLADTLARAVTLNWEIGTLPGEGQAITGLLQRRDGAWITASADGTLRVWREGRPAGPPIATGQGEIHCLLELADGLLVSGGADGTLRRWKESEPLGPPIPASPSAVLSLAQLSDGEMVSGDEQGNLRRWRDFRPIGAPIPAGQGRLTALLPLPDGELLSGGSGGEGETASQTLRRWRQGTPTGPPIPTGHDGVLQLINQGGRVLSLGGEGAIQLWQPGRRAAIPWGRLPTPVRRLALLPSGQLVTSHDDGSLRRWRGDQVVAVGYASSAGIRQLVGLKDGRLVGADPSGQLRLLDPSTALAQPVPSGQRGVWSLLLTGQGHLLSGGEDGSLRSWRQEKPLGPPLPSGQGGILALTELANGDILSGGSLLTIQGEEQSSLRRWRGSTPITPPIATEMGTIRQLISSGGEEVLSFGDGPSGSGLMRRWRVDDGAPVALGAPLSLPPPRLNSLVRLANGDLLSASRMDGLLQRWHPNRLGAPRRGAVIPTGLDGISTLALLKGERYLAVGTVDRRGTGQEVRVLDLRTGAWVGSPILLEAGWASALAVLPDQGLVIGDTTGHLRWLEPRRVLAGACRELAPRRATAGGARPDGPGKEVEKLACGACGC
jgi:WD40 repeat protein